MKCWGQAIVVLFFLASVVPAQQMRDDQYQASKSQGTAFTEKDVFAPIAPVARKEPPKLWSGGVEFGIAGSQGNTEVTRVRLAGNVKRESVDNIWTADLLYGLTHQNGVNSENKALFNTRDEILIPDTPWSVFGAGQLEYDELRAYDFRVAAHTGVGYLAIQRDNLTVRTRLGAGFSREVGGPNDRWVPEGLLGGDLAWKITDRQRFVSSLDIYPDLGHVGEYRVRARAAYEVLVAPEWGGMTLRLGVQDRYDSNPGNALRNDLDFFTTLMFKF